MFRNQEGQQPLPRVLQNEVKEYIGENNEPEEKNCYQPIVVYYDRNRDVAFDYTCLLPSQNDTNYRDYPNVERRSRSMTGAICRLEIGYDWCLLCACFGYTPTLCADCIYLIYSCCIFLNKKYQTRQQDQDRIRFLGIPNESRPQIQKMEELDIEEKQNDYKLSSLKCCCTNHL